MAAPIRSQTEIDQILNRANHTIADLGHELIVDANQGKDISDVDYRDKVYRLILLRAYLKNIIDPTTGDPKLYYTATANAERYNKLLDGVVALSKILDGPGIPMIRGRRAPILYFPSTSGPSSGGQSNSGGAAAPGGVTFQNTDVNAPGEVVDRMDASGSEYAFYIVVARGTGAGEGSRLDIIGVNWRGASDPVITNYRGNDVGGSTTGVTYSAAIVDGMLELTCNVPTDGWVVRGTRVSFENISFQNAQGPLPTGGTAGQYLRKTSSTDYEAAFASIAISEVALLQAALDAKVAKDGSIAMTGNLQMGTNKVTGLAAGTTAGDALRYEQLVGLYLLLTGGTMAGNIAMGGNKVTGLAAASGAGEAVRYEQLPTSLPPDGAAGGDLTGTYPNPTLAEARVKSVGVQLLQKVVDIGTWDMSTVNTVSIAHGISSGRTKIKSVSVKIYNDTATSIIDFLSNQISGTDTNSAALWNDTVVALSINLSASYFASTAFNSTASSRGELIITYEE